MLVSNYPAQSLNENTYTYTYMYKCSLVNTNISQELLQFKTGFLFQL